MVEEALTFCSRYLDGIEIVFNRQRHVNDEPHIVPSNVSTLFPQVGKPVGSFVYFTLSAKEKLQAHRHVLLYIWFFVQHYIIYFISLT